MQLAILFLLPALAAAVPRPNTCRLVDAIPFFNFGQDGRSSIEENEDLTVLTEFARFMNHKVPLMLEEFAHLKNILNVGRIENTEERGKDETVANLRMPKKVNFETEIRSMFEMADDFTRKQQSKLFFSKETTTTPAPTTTTTTTTEMPMDEDNNVKASIKKVVKKVVDSMKDVVDTIKSKPLSVESIKSIFAGIIEGVTKTLNDAGIPLPNTKPTEEKPEEPEPSSSDSSVSFFAKWPLVCKALWYPYNAEKCRTARCMACAPAMMASAQVCKRSEGVVSQRCLSYTLGDGFCNLCIADYSEIEY